MLPIYTVHRDFLPQAKALALLDYVQANEERFKPSLVGVVDSLRVDETVRVSSLLQDFGPMKQELRALLAPLAPALAAELKTNPFETSRIELELAAHNDGAFFRRHIDTQRADDEAFKRDLRVLSGVYYFHAMPKAFTGGALRLYAMGSRDEGKFVDVEPLHNSLVFFPSFMPHEVMRVSCPSKRFMDSRFAINCWFRKAL
jgi:SM-20-related protein